MEHRPLGNTGLKVSELCMGTMTFGWTAPPEAAAGVFDAFRDAGGNFIDTADVYSRWAEGNPGGVAEQLVGEWLQTQPRDQNIIATKVFGRMSDDPNDAGLSRAHIMNAVEGSLRRLNTDYIDLYQSHSFDPSVPLEESLLAFDDLVRQGKVRYIGCSNHTASQLLEALWTSDSLGSTPYVSIQPRYSLVKRADFERELMDVCARHGIGVIPYSPLAGGILTGKYRRQSGIPDDSRGASNEWIARLANERSFKIIDTLERLGETYDKTILQMALGWMLSNPVISSPIIGVNSVEQWQELEGAIGLRLSDEDLEILNEASAWEPAWEDE